LLIVDVKIKTDNVVSKTAAQKCFCYQHQQFFFKCKICEFKHNLQNSIFNIEMDMKIFVYK